MVARLVAHRGFEPLISALRGRCPGPLDECATSTAGIGPLCIQQTQYTRTGIVCKPQWQGSAVRFRGQLRRHQRSVPSIICRANLSLCPNPFQCWCLISLAPPLFRDNPLTLILLDSPYWALHVWYFFFDPLGVTTLFVAVVTGLLCGRYMKNLSVLKGFVVAILALVVVVSAVDFSVQWFPGVHHRTFGAFMLVLSAVATFGATCLWNLFAAKQTEAGRAERWSG